MVSVTRFTIRVLLGRGMTSRSPSGFLVPPHKLNISFKSCACDICDGTAARGEMQYTDNVLLMMLEQEVAELKAFHVLSCPIMFYRFVSCFLICMRHMMAFSPLGIIKSPDGSFEWKAGVKLGWLTLLT